MSNRTARLIVTGFGYGLAIAIALLFATVEFAWAGERDASGSKSVLVSPTEDSAPEGIGADYSAGAWRDEVTGEVLCHAPTEDSTPIDCDYHRITFEFGVWTPRDAVA